MTELKPCPFCGGAVSLEITKYDSDGNCMRAVVSCEPCTLEMHKWTSEEELDLHNRWNTRPDTAEREALVKQLSDYIVRGERPALMAIWVEALTHKGWHWYWMLGASAVWALFMELWT